MLGRIVAVVLLCAVPKVAEAQFKNRAFSVYGGAGIQLPNQLSGFGEVEFLQKISLERLFLKIGTSFRISRFVAIEPEVGLRVHFATDFVRPFFEGGVKLFIPLPPAEVRVAFGVYGALGIEFIIARDIGLIFIGRYTLQPPVLNPVLVHQIDGLAGASFYF